MGLYADIRYFVLYTTLGLFRDKLQLLNTPLGSFLRRSLYRVGRLGVFVSICSGMVLIIPILLVGDFLINGTISNAVYALTTPVEWPLINGIRFHLPFFGAAMFIPGIILTALFDGDSSETVDRYSITFPEEHRSISHIDAELGEVAANLYLFSLTFLVLTYLAFLISLVTPIYAVLAPLSPGVYLLFCLKLLSVMGFSFFVSCTLLSLYLSWSGEGSFRENRVYFSPDKDSLTGASE